MIESFEKINSFEGNFMKNFSVSVLLLFLTINLAHASSSDFKQGAVEAAVDLRNVEFDLLSTPSSYAFQIPSVSNLCSASEVPSLTDELAGSYPAPSPLVDGCFNDKWAFIGCASAFSSSLKPLVTYFTGRGDELTQYLTNELSDPVTNESYLTKISQNGIDILSLRTPPAISSSQTGNKIFLFKEVDTHLTLIALIRASQLLVSTASTSTPPATAVSTPIGIPSTSPNPAFYPGVTVEEMRSTIGGLYVTTFEFPMALVSIAEQPGGHESEMTRGELCELSRGYDQEMIPISTTDPRFLMEIPSSLQVCFNSAPGFIECVAAFAGQGKSTLYVFFKRAPQTFREALANIPGVTIQEGSTGIFNVIVTSSRAGAATGSVTFAESFGTQGFATAVRNLSRIMAALL